MEAKIKAAELVESFYWYCDGTAMGTFSTVQVRNNAKKCAIIAVENEYHALRELIFLLRSNTVIENEKTFLHFIDLYTKEEAEVKKEIELL